MADGWAWRPMRAGDLPSVEAIAECIHVDYPEDAAVFAERRRLYPAGCLVLAGGAGIGGYVISHPWMAGTPPALDTLLGALPDRPDSYYIHDLALLPAYCGIGAAMAGVELLAAQAASLGLGEMSLIAVGLSQPFWTHCGFATATCRAEALASYAGAASFMVRRIVPT